MKKIFLMFALAFGMFAMQSCNSCVKESGVSMDFVYDVVATAQGQGQFAWTALPHTGDITLAGELTINATNDTTAVKVFTAPNLEGAPTLSAGLASEDAKVREAAEVVEQRLSVSHLSGEYKLAIKGYAKYGPMYFVIDEEFPKPAAE